MLWLKLQLLRAINKNVISEINLLYLQEINKT